MPYSTYVVVPLLQKKIQAEIVKIIPQKGILKLNLVIKK